MAKKPKRRKNVDPFLLFANAISYQLVSQILDQYPAQKSLLSHPIMANQTFALELFIKALHRSRRRHVVGHDIVDLFNKLGKADRKNITQRFSHIIVKHPEHADMVTRGVAFEVDSVLHRAQRLFVNARYWHEMPAPSTDSKGFGGNIGVGNLSDAIRDLLFELHPDWLSKLHNFRIKFPGSEPLPS